MSESQKTTEELPPYTVIVPTATEKKRSTKKYVIIAVTVVLTVVIILTAILVGLYLSYNAQKDLLKFTVNVDKDSKQEVTSDPNNNVVQYHVQNPNYDLWVINDFNRDIQTLKVKDNTETVCFVVPLNRSVSLSPSDISKEHATKNEDSEGKNASDYAVRYRVSGTPIPDTSFLSKTASVGCKGISTYWVYPYCDNVNGDQNQKQKRAYCKRTVRYCCRRGFLWICTAHCTDEIWGNC